MSILHYIGVAFVLIIITAIGVYSGKKVKSADDFSNGGRKAGAGIVAGTIIGSLVGGSSTIGTAQLAYTYGFSAWWFTLGAGLGCLILGCCFAKPLYNSGIQTLPQVLSKEYGKKTSTVATILTSLGNFLTVASQVLSGIALITAVSQIGSTAAAIITVFMMLVYVIFGGVWGAGYVGIAKTVLLYSGVGACGIIAISLQGGLSSFSSLLPNGQYFNIFARGISKDLGSGLSLIFGVMSTQAYIQAIISAKSLKVSRAGAFICAALIPVIGIAGIYIGMFMRINHPNIQSVAALPMFILEYLNPIAGGMILATLLVTVVGTGAGITLGISTMFCNDIYKIYYKKKISDKKLLNTSRIVIIAILLSALFFSFGNLGTMILSLGFMSMGLRGAVAFIPLCTALFLPKKIEKKYILLSMIAAPLGVLFGNMLIKGIDSLFVGMGISFVIVVIGYVDKNLMYKGTL